jgi:hypothetical protein
MGLAPAFERVSPVFIHPNADATNRPANRFGHRVFPPVETILNAEMARNHLPK